MNRCADTVERELYFNKIKSRRGITLVALVITIVILLILVGISISSLTGSGLFSKAQQALEESNYANAEEKVKLAIIASYDNTGALDNEMLKNNLNNIDGIKSKITEIKYDLRITVDGCEFLISKDGQVTCAGQSDNQETKSYKISAQLQKWLTATNENITLDDIISNETLIKNMKGLMPILDGNNLNRSTDENGVISYELENGEKLTVSSEYSTEYAAWRALEGKYESNSFTYSEIDKANGYYLEYAFKQDTYVIACRLKITNASNTQGERIIKIQAFNEENQTWDDLTQEIDYIGNINSGYPDEIIQLTHNNRKIYKRYRMYVTSIGTSTGYGAECSGVCGIQFYGFKTSNNQLTNQEIIVETLNNESIEELTMSNMIDSKTLMERLMKSNKTMDLVLADENIRNVIFSSNVALSYIEQINDILNDSNVTYISNNKYRTPSNDFVYSSSLYPNDNYYVYKAFDGNYINDSSWPPDWSVSAFSTYPTETNFYLVYEFENPIFAYKFKYQVSHGASATGTRKYVIQASNDGETWIDITNQTEHNGSRWVDTCELIPEYNSNNVKKYKMFRIYTLEMSGNCELNCVGEFEIYGVR